MRPIIEDVRKVTKCIYNHPGVLHLIREYTNGKELVRLAVPRSAKIFLALQNVISSLTSLKQMFVSQLKSYSKKLNGQSVAYIVFDNHFFKAAIQIVKVSWEL